ncbi:MAG: hypothetical protein ABGX16_02340 [Pirellulales bacterium]
MKNDDIDKIPESWSRSSGALAPNFYSLSDYERFDERGNGLSRHGRLQFVRATGLMRSGTGWLSQVILSAILLCSPFATPAVGQSVPKERRITYREQSLTPYDPFSADELWKRIKIPPSPGLSPTEALKSFTVAPGFRIECVAAEPLVVDPVMFEFDSDGRIWAVEFRGWMRDIHGTGEGDPLGQVVVLEDTDGDGLMDKSTVFLDKLVMPRTISFVTGGKLPYPQLSHLGWYINWG